MYGVPLLLVHYENSLKLQLHAVLTGNDQGMHLPLSALTVPFDLNKDIQL
jgi:hypothetical protein